MNEELLGHLKNPDTWKRVVLIVLFVIIAQVLELAIAVVVLFQVILTVVTGSQNEPVREFGAQLANYLYQIVRYVTYNSDERPFPFSGWPDADEPAAIPAGPAPTPPPPPSPGPEPHVEPQEESQAAAQPASPPDPAQPDRPNEP